MTLVGDRELPLRGPPVGTLLLSLVGDRELPLRGPPVGTLRRWRLLIAGPPGAMKVKRVMVKGWKVKRTSLRATWQARALARRRRW